jgi:hypothetical protein
MRKLPFIILAVILFNSCHHDYKLCDCNSNDYQVKIYNDILNELVEHHFYNMYLGKDWELIDNEYDSHPSDTSKIRKEIIQLQNKMFNDTARFCNIYLDTVFMQPFKQWTQYQNDTGWFTKNTKDLIFSFSTDVQSVIDSLNSMQLRLDASDFHLCTSKVLSIGDSNNQQGKCGIGIISFSKLFLDKNNNNGLLYYNWRCGELCGKGELLRIEKVNNRWIIIQTIPKWFS